MKAGERERHGPLSRQTRERLNLRWFDVEMFLQCKHIHHLLPFLQCRGNRLRRRKRARGKHKTDATQVTQSAVCESGNGKIRNSFTDQKEREKPSNIVAVKTEEVKSSENSFLTHWQQMLSSRWENTGNAPKEALVIYFLIVPCHKIALESLYTLSSISVPHTKTLSGLWRFRVLI